MQPKLMFMPHFSLASPQAKNNWWISYGW
jgi:hypothetical protein